MKKVLFIFVLFHLSLSIECYGAEYRTIEVFTYGRFEVRMMTGQGDGSLASFFTYNTNLNNDVYSFFKTYVYFILGCRANN